MKDLPTLAFSIYKTNLIGLPSFVRLVMLEIYEYFDYKTGTITITSLDKLARDHFQVDSERGRQKENINGDTLRNAFRTIKKFKSDYFQFTKVNQKIVIDMPFMRQLHQSFFNETQEVAAIVATATTLTPYGAQASLPPILATDVATELAEASLEESFNAPAKIKTNKTNKKTRGMWSNGTANRLKELSGTKINLLTV
jgi:hypothetical protein